VSDLAQTLVLQKWFLTFALLDGVNYPTQHQVEFSFVESDCPDPDGLLPALRATVSREVRLTDLLIEIGHNLLLRTRYGGNEVFLSDGRTHVVAVLGTPDALDDDWFCSDFCLLHKVFGGTAKTEAYLTCVNLKEFVMEHGPLKHGHPNKAPRKIVFDKGSEEFYVQHDPSILGDAFLEAVRTTSANAMPGERILVIIVAHGQRYTGDIYLGLNSEKSKRRTVSRLEVEASLAYAPNGVQITIISTACFSGLWILPLQNPLQEASILAATTDEAPSFSSPLSNDSGFMRGGFFSDAISQEFTGLAVQRSVLGTGYQEPLYERSAVPQLQRAISVGDLGASSQLLEPPTGQFPAFCRRLQGRFANHPLVRPPQFSFSDHDRKLPAAAVLGGNNELTTLFRAEGVLSLKPEDPFVVVGLGVENIYKTGGDSPKKAASYGNAAWYMFEKAILIEGHPEDNAIVRMGWQLKDGKLSIEKQEKLWKILVWRFGRDSWAECIVRKFCRNFPPISSWRDDFRQEKSSVFGSILSKVNKDPPITLSAVSYTRPVRYIQAAAHQEGITPARLEECLSDGVVAPSQRPPIPPRSSSLQACTQRVYNVGNWSSVSLVESFGSSMSLNSSA
jgi:hypothetical protein